jgi:hypothetical protein
MADQRGEPVPDRRRPYVDLRFLPPATPEARPSREQTPGWPGNPATITGPGGEQPVAGRQAETTEGGSRLVGRATIARLRGAPPATRPSTVPDEPAPRPAASDAGRVVLVYEQVRRPWRLWVFTAMLVSLTVGVVLGQTEAYRASKPRSVTVADAAQPSAVAPAPVAPLTAPLGTTRQRQLQITGGVMTLRLRTAQLGEAMYSITGLDPGIPARVEDLGDSTTLILSPDAVVTGGAEVVLNAAVQWTVKLTGGANDLDVDARAGGLAAVESVSPVARGTLQLAKPRRPVPLTITGPVGDLTVRTPVGAPVRVRMAAGAGQATIGGTVRRNVKNGATLQERGWRGAAGRYDIRLAARANTVLVERVPPEPGTTPAPSTTTAAATTTPPGTTTPPATTTASASPR